MLSNTTNTVNRMTTTMVLLESKLVVRCGKVISKSNKKYNTCLIFGVSIGLDPGYIRTKGIFDRSKFKVTRDISPTISGWLLVIICNKKSQSNLEEPRRHHSWQRITTPQSPHWLQWDAPHLPPNLHLPFEDFYPM